MTMLSDGHQTNRNGKAAGAGAGTLRAAIYLRVSTVEAAQSGNGLDSQRRLCRDHCERMGWHVTKEYADEGISGSTLAQRPAIQELLADALQGCFDVALAADVTRWSRGDFMEWGLLAQAADRSGIRLVTPAETLYDPSSEESRLLLWVKGGMSEDEKRRIVFRLVNGKLDATRKGKICAARPPYGYRFQQIGRKASEKELVENPQEAEIVRMIFRLVASGEYATRGLAFYLTEQGIRAPGGGRWPCGTVNRIIRETAYRGEWAWRKSVPTAAEPRKQKNPGTLRKSSRPRPVEERLSIPIPPLVDEELWQRANAAVDFRSEHGRGRPAKNGPALLTSYLRCPHCGFAMLHHVSHVERSPNSRAYFCLGRGNWKGNGLDAPCENPRHRAQDVEATIWAALAAIIRDPETAEAMAQAADDARRSEGPGIDRAEVGRALEKLAAKEERILGAFADGDIDRAQLQTQLAKFKTERQGFEGLLAAAQELERGRQERAQLIFSFQERCRLYQTVDLDRATPEERRGIVEDLVERITLDREGNFKLTPLVGEERTGRVGGNLSRVSRYAGHFTAGAGLVLSGTVRRAA